MDKFKYCKSCENFGKCNGSDNEINLCNGKLYICDEGYFELDCFKNFEGKFRKEDLTNSCLLHGHIGNFIGNKRCNYIVENNLQILEILSKE